MDLNNYYIFFTDIRQQYQRRNKSKNGHIIYNFQYQHQHELCSVDLHAEWWPGLRNSINTVQS